MANSIQDQLRGARNNIIKKIRSKQEWMNLKAEYKIKSSAPILHELGKEKFTNKELAETLVDEARKFKTMQNFEKVLKKDFGMDPKMRKRFEEAIFKNEMSVKDLKSKFKLNQADAEKVFSVTKGASINKTGLRDANKKIEMIRRRNVAMSVRARDEDDANMAQSIASRRQKGEKNSVGSMENEDSGRLGVAGMTYSAGVGTKKVSTQDFRGQKVASITSASSYRTSGAGVAQSGGVLNQGKGAASIAGGIGAKQMPSSGPNRGAAPLGFRKAA